MYSLKISEILNNSKYGIKYDATLQPLGYNFLTAAKRLIACEKIFILIKSSVEYGSFLNIHINYDASSTEEQEQVSGLLELALKAGFGSIGGEARGNFKEFNIMTNKKLHIKRHQ